MYTRRLPTYITRKSYFAVQYEAHNSILAQFLDGDVPIKICCENHPLPTFRTHRFNSSNSIEANNLVNRGTADRASPLLRLYILQAGHATSHVTAWDAGAFHRSIQTYNTSTCRSFAAVACISFTFFLFRRCCRCTDCCTAFGGSRHGYINRRRVYGWIVNRTTVEGFFSEWWRSWGWKSLECFLWNQDWRVGFGFVGFR